jgi:photosynthetic reaction center cytochrome c subunit
MRTLIAAILITLFPLCAQDAADKQDKQDKGKRAPAAPTNLKILKVTTGPEVIQIMRTFTTGLGVQCNYCHVQGNNASDDKPKKEIARKMIVMVQQVNTNFPDGKMHVSCYTCHRGEAEPKTAPAAQ